jgi:HAD superfamily hydrolase (TIGR01458 family)
LVACQKNRYWREAGGLSLDAGPFVAALEYAASVRARVVGKPSREFFLAALSGTDVEPSSVLVVGDDVETDVLGATSAGMRAALVRTGKYRPGDEERVPHQGVLVLESLASLPEALAGGLV